MENRPNFETGEGLTTQNDTRNVIDKYKGLTVAVRVMIFMLRLRIFNTTLILVLLHEMRTLLMLREFILLAAGIGIAEEQ